MNYIKRIFLLLLLLLLLFATPFLLTAQQSLSGTINMPDGQTICDVLVELQDDAGAVIDQDLSDANGAFTIGENLTIGDDYSLVFSKESSPLNGTSTFDLVLLFRIILGIDIPSPYAIWAADVNESGTMTTLDMVLIRRLILAIDEDFSTTSWAFDAPETVLPDNTIEVLDFNGDENIVVIGVKRGDLNYTADPGCE